MRSCAACFWCPLKARDVIEGTGECWNRPPVVVPVPGPPDAEGRVDVQIISVRPTVGLQEYCHHFSHHNEHGKGRAHPD